jgi:hypothetical protein
MYIYLSCSDQDLYLGLLEIITSRLLFWNLLSLRASASSSSTYLKHCVTCMPTYRIPQYFVIFDAQFPLGFAFLFPFLDNWLLLAPFSHQLLHLVEEPTPSHVA